MNDCHHEPVEGCQLMVPKGLTCPPLQPRIKNSVILRQAQDDKSDSVNSKMIQKKPDKIGLSNTQFPANCRLRILASRKVSTT